ncbi:DUF3748 domain-containing protein [Faecalibacter bovis]|uniref:DUF3748 domain-containing protein n=1 Tax=Faecalibacter bovis TaxID=2898187 RepID=A0ABX7XCB6_9FLAO|nr:DUF3748 domain-containing protein [Faecalibacter bovis]QTV05498.1 DUF3748 domain-containing protein [Faecalibacter bovis]
MKKAIQLTFGNYGHTLHHCQVFSPDNHWIVYDTRNEDSQIGTTTRIERVKINTKQIEVLYEVQNPNEFGPGVGAATFSPEKDKVIFIHGIQNASQSKPYGISRRTGVAIDLSNPNIPIHMDARNIYSPFSKGALRGGTHSHCWNYDGSMISFTYNDYVLAYNKVKDERVVGVMFPKKVNIPSDSSLENITGEMFSVIVSKIVDDAVHGSDEIEKAFDECWLGNTNKLVFQGWVRDLNGNRKTEVFMIDLPDDLTQPNDVPLEGTEILRPGVPKGVIQKRMTYTENGISNFRHWLRSNPAGDVVYFLKEDSVGNTQLYSYNINQSEIKKLTDHTTSIQSPFNIAPDGKTAIYKQNDSLILLDLVSLKTEVIYSNKHISGIPNFDKTGNNIVFNQYVLNDENKLWLQIFTINLLNG